tara:strand:+ start:97 stop:333 length:237 start_codon:yes stop_codon:yes gene_type:complete
MTYNVQLDVSHETTFELVNEFATGHGCTATLILENGPAGGNPLYQFSSDKFSYLEELIGQLLGYTPDEEALKTMVWEV